MTAGLPTYLRAVIRRKTVAPIACPALFGGGEFMRFSLARRLLFAVFGTFCITTWSADDDYDIANVKFN